MSRPTDLPEAADLLRPYVGRPDSSHQTRIVYADILNHLSHQQPQETGIASCEEARGILAGIGALDLTDLGATSVYADTADSQARHALELGRLDDAARLEQEVYELAEKVLQRRPGDLRSMANRALSAGLLGQLAFRRFDYAAAMEYAVKSEQAGKDYVAFDPSDANPWVYWIRGKAQVAVTLLEQGRVQDAMKEHRSAMALQQDEPLLRDGARFGNFRGAGFRRALGFYMERFARGHAPSVRLMCGIASMRFAMRYPRTFATFWNQTTSGGGR